MKKLYIYILLVVICFSIVACKKGFLEEQPFTFYSGEVYTSIPGANAALNGAYASAANFNFFGGVYPQVISVTGLETRTNLIQSLFLNSLEYGANNDFIARIYTLGYEIINRCNGVIKFVGESSISANDKNNIIGQAYFLRAVTYFNLVRLYGALPLHVDPVDQTNINLPRTPVDQIYDFIISDLKKAEQMLPEPAAQAVDRPNKYAAPALLGKVYLTRAGNTPSSPFWQLAKDELLKVVNSNAYILVPKFADLWDVTKENSKESIFEVQFSAIQGTPNGQLTTIFMPSNTIFTPLTTTGQPFARIRFNKEMYDDHLSRYPGDPRFAETYLGGTVRNKTNTGNILIYPANKTTQGWPYLFKYRDPNFIVNQGDHNFIYLRYADVLLMLAEAENEISGPANAYQYVNQVLARARLSVTPSATQPANFAGMTQDQFRTRIMLERRYELAGEMHQWYDIRRRGLDYYRAVIQNHNNNPSFAVGFDTKASEEPNVVSRTMLLPISDVELNRNSALKPADQNPGY